MIDHNQLVKLYNEIYQPVKEKLIQHNLKNILPLWRKKYLLIKDESWPACNTFEDFENLPDWIRTECITQHQFSPDIYKQAIIDDADYPFKLPPLDKHIKIISDNIDCIVDKDIVDFACNSGGYSFTCWKAGANSIVGFDIRDDNLKMAHALQEFFEVPDDKLKFIKLDVHDYESVTDLCKNKDTALVPGIMYHVHDHYQILLSIAKANVTNIIIETGENKEILDSKEPLVWWKTEPTFEFLSGWMDNHGEIPVGYPNRAWFELIMAQLGYKLVSKQHRTVPQSKAHSDEFSQPRRTYVFQIDHNGNSVL